ncbi:FadR/GntR family transcriptional regulator [Sphaerochaeta sp. PS]|uniref:FadR/GntR family transcriptional regulator n=1 Tax=Sphaerochaeta sp. PS TaxID=3076336 RepID=UPI0028A2FFD7|nr:FadR/GntR family transcriptional regulator [Sphaerochaeta sp. PS]MDT4762246.1 FadR/GntR family transcriptional regulator [Sphaerochaeta sp. PS]
MKEEAQQKTTSLRIQIYTKLRKLIEQDTWEIGEKLPSEKDLCEQFSVSRVTIRSAIQQLEAVGLVQTHQGGRTVVVRTEVKGAVASLNPLKAAFLQSDIIKVLEYRMVVEKGTIGLAVQHLTDEDLVALEEIFNSMIVHHDDIEKFSKADYLFHRKIAESSKNPILIQANQSIEEVLSTTMHSIVSILGCAIGIRYHRLLLANMRKRDKASCEQLMEEHIQATIDGVQSFLQVSQEPIL